MSNIPEIVQAEVDKNIDYFGGSAKIEDNGIEGDSHLYLAHNPQMAGTSVLYFVNNNQIIDKKEGIFAIIYGLTKSS